MFFKVGVQCSTTMARTTFLQTSHAKVETPVFMPVGTHGVVRTQSFAELEKIGAQILLTNTYHLHLKPGPVFLEKIGGLRKFSGWKYAFLTDSGGFQIFCMPLNRKLTDEGAHFRSYINGDEVFLSPEQSIATQKAIGSDIMMVLDECVPSTVDFKTAERAMQRTHLWAQRSVAAHEKDPRGQKIFAIVQGACYPELRKQSADFIANLNVDGIAVGGLAVGESFNERLDMTAEVTRLLPQDKPRYLMGVGTPLDLVEAIARGIDMFDCIIPTSLGQQGVVFTSEGKLDFRKAMFKEDMSPIDPNCPCEACGLYTRAYSHHLLKSQEFLVWQYLAAHNLFYYMTLMHRVRTAIRSNSFPVLLKEIQKLFGSGIVPS